MTWREFSLFVRASQQTREEDLNKWRILATTIYNASPKVDKKHKAIKPQDFIRLSMDQSPEPEVMGVSDFVKMLAKEGRPIPKGAEKWL